MSLSRQRSRRSGSQSYKAGEPNALVDLLDAEPLTGQHGGDVDPLAMQAEAGRYTKEVAATRRWIQEARQAQVRWPLTDPRRDAPKG